MDYGDAVGTASNVLLASYQDSVSSSPRHSCKPTFVSRNNTIRCAEAYPVPVSFANMNVLQLHQRRMRFKEKGLACHHERPGSQFPTTL